MRRTRNEAVETRRRIVKAASRLIREKGPDKVSVADVMTASGMTHGGFYVHFSGKDALVAEATRDAFAEKLDPFDSVNAASAEALRSYVDSYMTQDHVSGLGFGCPIAGLGPETARAAPAMRLAMSEGVQRTVETFARDLSNPGENSREQAIRTLVSIVGSLVVARTLPDRNLQDEVLAIMRRSEPLRSVLQRVTATGE